MDKPLLARIEPQRDIALIAADDLRISSGGPRDRAALADLHLDIVDDRADRDAGERHRVAGLHIDLHSRHNLVADGETLRGDDISVLTVRIFDQRNEGGAVRIVFQPLDLRDDIQLAPLEVDDAIGLLVTAAAKPHRHAAGIVAAALLGLANGQPLEGLALVKLAAVDDGELTKARRRRFECLKRHDPKSSEARGHVDTVTVGQRDDRLLEVLLAAANPAEGLRLALADQRVDRRNLDLEQLLDSSLDLRLGRVGGDLEDELIVL